MLHTGDIVNYLKGNLLPSSTMSMILIIMTMSFRILNTDLFVAKKMHWRDFPGGPLLKTMFSNAADTGLISGWGAKISHASQSNKPKQTRTSTVTNSRKTLNMVYIKKNL